MYDRRSAIKQPLLNCSSIWEKKSGQVLDRQWANCCCVYCCSVTCLTLACLCTHPSVTCGPLVPWGGHWGSKTPLLKMPTHFRHTRDWFCLLSCLKIALMRSVADCWKQVGLHGTICMMFEGLWFHLEGSRSPQALEKLAVDMPDCPGLLPWPCWCSSCQRLVQRRRAFMKKLLTVLSSRPSCCAIVSCISLLGRLFSLKMAISVRRCRSVNTRRCFLGTVLRSFSCSCSFRLQAAERIGNGRKRKMESWVRVCQWPKTSTAPCVPHSDIHSIHSIHQCYTSGLKSFSVLLMNGKLWPKTYLWIALAYESSLVMLCSMVVPTLHNKQNAWFTDSAFMSTRMCEINFYINLFSNKDCECFTHILSSNMTVLEAMCLQAILYTLTQSAPLITF